MSFSIDQKIFKNILDSVKEISPKNKNNIQEIRLLVDENGLSITTTNAEENLFADIYLSKNIFAKYDIITKNYIDLNAEILRKSIPPSDTINIKFLKTSGEKVEEICLSYEKKFKSSYVVKSIDEGCTLDRLEKFDYNLTFTIDLSLFKQMISRLSNHADTCLISCSDNELKFKIDSNTVTAEEVVSIEDLEDVSEESDLPIIKINIEKLNSILKINTLSDKIVVEMGDDMPMCISYIKENSYMKYYLMTMMLVV